MYPVKNLPLIFSIASHLNPLTFGIDALKHTIFRDAAVSDFPLMADISILVIASIAFVIAAGLLFERKK
jgi:ABC-type polysaccharide/polyol phosphate export permease